MKDEKKWLVFYNPGQLQKEFLQSFGVSVKEGENPVGHFGTGMKYALAIIKRLGGEIVITSDAGEWIIGTGDKILRGQWCTFLTLNDGETDYLPFTTHLGEHWKPWMAYRELRCNATDEGGGVTIDERPAVVPGQTRIYVNCPELMEIYHKEKDYFIGENDPPSWVEGTAKIYNRSTESYFYRNIKVAEGDVPFLFTWNEFDKRGLTEDRTLQSSYLIGSTIRAAVMLSEDPGFISRVLLAPKDTMEGRVDYAGWGIVPSETFIKVVSELQLERFADLPSSAVKVWEVYSKKHWVPNMVQPSKVEQKQLERAIFFCEKWLGAHNIHRYPIMICTNLGDGVFGLADRANSRIYIARQQFQNGGAKGVTSCIYEEYLHLEKGLNDMSRSMQQFLFDQLVSLGEELQGEPL